MCFGTWEGWEGSVVTLEGCRKLLLVTLVSVGCDVADMFYCFVQLIQNMLCSTSSKTQFICEVLDYECHLKLLLLAYVSKMTTKIEDCQKGKISFLKLNDNFFQRGFLPFLLYVMILFLSSLSCPLR